MLAAADQDVVDPAVGPVPVGAVGVVGDECVAKFAGPRLAQAKLLVRLVTLMSSPMVSPTGHRLAVVMPWRSLSRFCGWTRCPR